MAARNKEINQALKKLKQLTDKRADQGWAWVKKGTTQKQISPDKIENHIQDGWKIIQV